MKNMTLQNIAQACNGRYVGEEIKKEYVVDSITTDSRQAKEGYLFVAIKGERVDGHSFISSVFEQGALCVLAEEESDQAAGPIIYVDSTLEAVKAIARFYLEQLGIPVVGITGSVGKTSTKEMIAAVLSQKYNTLKTAGNFNNELGLPLTVFRLRDEHEIAVLEMGISHFGEMHRLAEIAKPDTCVITNIGQCHLEFLGDRDGVLKAKTEIFEFLKPDAHIVLNGDDDKLATVTKVNEIKPVFFGVNKGDQFAVWADQIESQGLKGISCIIHKGSEAFSVLVPIPGYHMVYNALAGTAVGSLYGMTMEEIKAGIESLQPVSGRFHIIETDQYTIVDDCYNANPMSMKASLDVLKDALGRKVALLGDMGELGEEEVKMHRSVGIHAAECGIDLLVCVGPLCKEMAAAAIETNPQLCVQHFENLETFLEQRAQVLEKGDTVLVKASHFMGFEKAVDMLQK